MTYKISKGKPRKIQSIPHVFKNLQDNDIYKKNNKIKLKILLT